jgi:hypothetical protein
MSNKRFHITKSHGGQETFSRKKLFRSLQRSGLSNKQCEFIADKVYHEVGEGSRTKDIFNKTFRLVKKTSPVAAVHYSLKRSIFELGPTGHYFELFVARYFEKKGFSVKTCKTLKGLLVNHEVDVIAEKDGKKYFVECKFHNRTGIKNDIKIVLYVKSRWDDLKQGPDGKNLTGFYLATNTAFSSDAITYAKGTGLRLMGVNAPPEKSFLEEVKEGHLYPVTSLIGLSKIRKITLLEKNIVLATDLADHIKLLFDMGMKELEIDQLLQEVERLKESNL